jgi:CheY-like chemotaxis protein
MIAAEDERHETVCNRSRHESGNPAARLLDLREKSHPLVTDRARFSDGRLHVAPVFTAAAELFDPRFQTCIADRRRAHVDPAPARSKVEPGADDGDRPPVPLNLHAGKATVGVLMSDEAQPQRRSQIRVLIADDDRPFLASLQELIERQPELSVIGAAADGLEAIELADDLDPDAVVIDLHMPLLDGVTAAARLRRDHANLCLIALTGDEEPALHRAVREAGADEVLLKSELVEGLLERLAAARANG